MNLNHRPADSPKGTNRGGWLLASAALLVFAELAARAAGWPEHTSVLAGMPRSDVSWLVGPLYVALHLAVVVFAPILALAGTARAVSRR